MTEQGESSDGATATASSSFIRELDIRGEVIRIKQLYIGDVGCVVWDAAIVLCKFLENEHYFPKVDTSSTVQTTRYVDRLDTGADNASSMSYWNGKRVIDLGSGTGVVGIAAGVLGADVVVSDLPEFVDLMSTNIDLNKSEIRGSVTAKALIWGQDVGNFLPKPDVVLMADVVYYEESLECLVKTLADLCGERTKIIMCYEERTTGNKPEIERKFFKLMEKQNFLKTLVPFETLDTTYRSRDIHVVMFNL